MFGIGGFELLIILIFGFIFLGDRLPDVAKTLGRALRTFQSAQKDMNQIIREDVFDPNAEEPFKDPLAALDKMGDVAKKAGTSLAGDISEITAAATKKNTAEKKDPYQREDVPALPSDDAAESTQSDEAVVAETATAGAVSEQSGQAGQDAQADQAASAEPAEQAAQATESFAERRERYQRERAERLAQQAAAAAEAAAAESAEAEGEPERSVEAEAQPEAVPQIESDDEGKEE